MLKTQSALADKFFDKNKLLIGIFTGGNELKGRWVWCTLILYLVLHFMINLDIYFRFHEVLERDRSRIYVQKRELRVEKI